VATCRDCELFILATEHAIQDGKQCKVCPAMGISVNEDSTACEHFKNAFEGIFMNMPRNI